jgi:hypothetical protein
MVASGPRTKPNHFGYWIFGGYSPYLIDNSVQTL